MSSVYKGKIKSEPFNGEAQFEIMSEGLQINGLFNSIIIPFNHMKSLTLDNYRVVIATHEGLMEINQLGHSCQWFFNELKSAYDNKVLTAVKAEGRPILTATGKYSYDEGSIIFQNEAGACSHVRSGTCRVELFDDNLCILPEDTGARRVPLVFVNGLDDENYRLNLSLNTGESYDLFMMGRDYDPLLRDLKKGILDLREKNKAFIGELCKECGGLSFRDLVAGAQFMPEGIAVPMTELNKHCSALAAIVEDKIARSKMKDYYKVISELCQGSQIAVGVKMLPEEEVMKLIEKAQEELNERASQEGSDVADELTDAEKDALRWVIWAAAPSKNGRKVVVEFAFPGEAAATYVFDLKGSWEEFLPVINRAMEAVELAREVISISSDELKDDKYADYQIAISRTPALSILRNAYSGKVIHRSVESWMEGLKKIID